MVSKLWEGASDIFTDYEGTIVDASFDVGEYGTQMKLTFDEIDGREDGVFEYYSIPDSWETNDGGQTIERLDGKDPEVAPLKKGNAWMRFVIAAYSASNGQVIDDVGDDAPLRAGAWIGTRWRMEAVEGREYKDRDTKEKKKAKDKNFPVEYMGKDSGTAASGTGDTNGKVDNLSVLTDLHNPVLENGIADSAKTLDYNSWFATSYAAIQAAGVDKSQLADLLTAMGTRELYENLGGRG